MLVQNKSKKRQSEIRVDWGNLGKGELTFNPPHLIYLLTQAPDGVPAALCTDKCLVHGANGLYNRGKTKWVDLALARMPRPH